MTDRQPSPRQVQVHGVLERYGGNAVAAAHELGISDTAVRITERRYLEATGGPPLPRPVPLQTAMRQIPSRLDAIEARLAALENAVTSVAVDSETLTRAAQSLRDQVRELNARQPILLVERVATHRRHADGGEGGKIERSGR